MRRRSDTVRTYRNAFLERDGILELDALGARAWPALTVLDLDGWRLRTSKGFTRRANSVWPRAYGDRLDFDTKLANVERHYAERGLPTVFQVSPVAAPKGLDRRLAARGYAPSGRTEVRVAALEDLSGALGPPPPGVRPVDGPEGVWLDAWERARSPDAGARGLAERILARVPGRSRYAVRLVDDEVVAVGRAVLDGGWFGLADVATLPTWRRRGAARGIVAALVAWGLAEDAERAWLAVETDNAPAAALWMSLGFRSRYAYHYRTRPPTDRPRGIGQRAGSP